MLKRFNKKYAKYQFERTQSPTKIKVNTALIDLLGEKVLLSERTAYDTILSDKLETTAQSEKEYIRLYSMVLGDALKINWKNVKWFQLKRRLKSLLLWNKFKSEKLFKKLSPESILSLAKKVYELEKRPVIHLQYMLKEITLQEFIQKSSAMSER